MKIAPYVEKLNISGKYKEFQKKYPDAFMIAGFFVLDLESGQNIHQIDYYVPSQKKIAAFTLDKGVDFQLLQALTEKVPEQLDMQTNIDLDALEGILDDEMKNRGMTEEVKKIIAVLQNIDGKKIWNLNCVLSGMEILKAHVEDSSKTVLKMEKVSMMDLIKKVNPEQLKAMQAQKGAKGATKEPDAKDQIDKLSKLESQIEKEKQRLKESLNKKK